MSKPGLGRESLRRTGVPGVKKESLTPAGARLGGYDQTATAIHNVPLIVLLLLLSRQ